MITERTSHLEILAKRLERFARHVIVLRGGQSEKQRSDIAARLAAIPQTEERVIVATGRYLGGVSMIPVSIPFSLPCRSRGKARLPSMPAGCTVSTTPSAR